MMSKNIFILFFVFIYALVCAYAYEYSEYSYYDGDSLKKIYLLHDLTALKGVSEKEIVKNSKSVVNVNILKNKFPSTLIIKNKSLSSLDGLKDGLKVFASSPNGNGLALLPGGVIVYFHPNLSESEIYTWAQKHDYKIKEHLPLTTRNAWLLESAADLKALELAFELRKDPYVISTLPNFERSLQLK
ncbi:MAG: hypothetical protein HQK49_15505 [Oligoflexia bacterium]|nr:hypothetical protein [Oligoflexia bacterium]